VFTALVTLGIDVRNSDIKKCRNSSCPEAPRFDFQPCLRTCNSTTQMKSLVVKGLKAWFDFDIIADFVDE